MKMKAFVINVIGILLVAFLSIYSCIEINERDHKTPRKVIIDVDAGGDDAWALNFLIKSEQKFNMKILAITCTHGNTKVENVAVNVLRILTALNRTDIPIYKGPGERFITPPYENENLFYGKDGFSDIIFENETINLEAIKKDQAVNFLYEVIKDNKGEVSIICIAPLTNIALLFKMYPGIENEIKDIFIMGGNRHGVGNVPKMASEFNFYTDPEAANILFTKFKGKITVLPWETNLRPNLIFSLDWRFNTLGKNENLEIVKILNKVERKAFEGLTDWLPCDVLLALIFADECLVVTESKYYPEPTVELQGRFTRGQLILDHQNEGTGNVKIIDNLNETRVKEMLLFSVQSDQI